MAEVKNKSDFFNPLSCPPECPGCPHRHLSYARSLAQKQAWLHKKLFPWCAKIHPLQSIPPDAHWGYRKKVCLSAQQAPDQWQFGLIRNERLIPIHDCPIHSQRIRAAVSLFSECLPDADIFPLACFVQADRQITLVLKSKQMPDLKWLDATLTWRLAQIGIQGLWLHLNPCTGKKVFAKNTWHLIYGMPRSADENQCNYGPKAFQQLIPDLYHKALASAETFLAPSAKDMLIDLYCGIGTPLARWQKRCPRVIGVELDGEAVACARQNAAGVEILRGKCSHRIPQLIQWAKHHDRHSTRLLYVNPPRTGLEPAILEWIANEYQPHRMVYLSCSAGTLQRDLSRLQPSGYEVIQILPYDFFPRTLHVETLVLIKR